jgi:hypothetical protein
MYYIRKVVSEFVKSAVEQRTDGDSAASARILETPKIAVWAWQNGAVLPSLCHVLRICQVMEVDFIDIIMGKRVERENWASITLPGQKSLRRESKFDYTGADNALKSVLNSNEPVSIRAVARGCGYNQRILYKHLPDLCKRISARYLKHIKSTHLQRMNELRKEVREAVGSVYKDGLYPSMRRVSESLARPWVMRNPESRAARMEALAELGLR